NLATTHELLLDTLVYNSDDELDQSSTSTCFDELYLLCNIISTINSQELNDPNKPDDPIELDEEDNSDMESDIDEETAILEDEEVEREDNEYDMNSDLLSNHTHPAIDHIAKWNLRDLF
ncbi:4657_t:CDS:2, partial [Gigaspora rosea]